MTMQYDKIKPVLDLIDASPYQGIDKVILKKIAALSKNKGYCYASQQWLADELRTSKPSLQRHLYRLERDGALHVVPQAGSKQQNYYSVKELTLTNIANLPNFKPSPLHNGDTAEKVQQRLSKLHKGGAVEMDFERRRFIRLRNDMLGRDAGDLGDIFDCSDAKEVGCECDVKPEQMFTCMMHDPIMWYIDRNASDCRNCYLPPGFFCPEHYKGHGDGISIADEQLAEEMKNLNLVYEPVVAGDNGGW
jgi:hypothetical protein